MSDFFLLLNNEHENDPIRLKTIAINNRIPKLTKSRYKYETNPLKRKHIRKILLNKIEKLIDEFSVRIGQQACTITLHSSDNILQVFGAQPLKHTIELFAPLIKQEFHQALHYYVPTMPNLYQPLPELIIDGEHKTLDQLTQANLRTFISLLMKYATGRGKPGWDRPEMKPEWWPDIAPWANIRIDTRTDLQKLATSWKTVLQEIVKSCYRFYHQEDLLGLNVISDPTTSLSTNLAEGTPPYFHVLSVNEIMLNNNGGLKLDLTQVMNCWQNNQVKDFILKTDVGDFPLHIS